MEKDLIQVEGTIAKALKDHSEEFYPYLQSISQFSKAHSKIIEILNSPELESNKETLKAKELFEKAYKQRKLNLYFSILTTYMTGLKA